MTRIVVSGCNGKMGREIVSIVSEGSSDCQVVAGIDIHTTGNEEFPVFSKAEDVSVDADVLGGFFPSLCPIFSVGVWENPKTATCALHNRLQQGSGGRIERGLS